MEFDAISVATQT